MTAIDADTRAVPPARREWSWAAWLFAFACFFPYPALAIGTSSHWWYVPVFMGATAAFGLLVYYVAKYARRAQGVDVDLVYHELPPE